MCSTISPAVLGHRPVLSCLDRVCCPTSNSWTLDNKRHVLKLVGRTEPSGETASGQQPGSTASLSVPASPRNERPSAQTAVVCGRTVEYEVEGSTGRGDVVGVWTGHWNNAGRLCGGLIVSELIPPGMPGLFMCMVRAGREPA